MHKKLLIALADMIRAAEKTGAQFSPQQIQLLADFCQKNNPAFKRQRWLDYINKP